MEKTIFCIHFRNCNRNMFLVGAVWTCNHSGRRTTGKWWINYLYMHTKFKLFQHPIHRNATKIPILNSEPWLMPIKIQILLAFSVFTDAVTPSTLLPCPCVHINCKPDHENIGLFAMAIAVRYTCIWSIPKITLIAKVHLTFIN